MNDSWSLMLYLSYLSIFIGIAALIKAKVPFLNAMSCQPLSSLDSLVCC
ncbi:hypothetical protein KHM83_14205 [Fusibacter paucivorans]|uniref:Uncharacterized protein n=1 Tax=Fusibacter paucivorans TaxID=76009 RepID=A0ABS5PRP7_9FIRM|nr:hypothetical protein [Fusibacter paucivorans]MBS7527833.1 hypothetical protein [Fusibacter paucivorans]